MKKLIILIITSTLLSSCSTNTERKESSENVVICPHQPAPKYNPNGYVNERDQIYSLMAYAVIYKDWQDTTPGERGYNIGSVLADSNGNFACWSRNSVDITGNGTEHGEVRIMQNYLHNKHVANPNKGELNLKGYTIYTTLQPCAMCAGMMTLTNLKKTVYGQDDNIYGGALDRLQANTKEYCPYPRAVIHGGSTLEIKKEIDNKFNNYMVQNPNSNVTVWLSSIEAKELYSKATIQFLNYEIKYQENIKIYSSLIAWYKLIPSSYQPIPYEQCCGFLR